MYQDHQNNHQYNGHARIRNVPIYVESRGDGVSPNRDSNGEENETYGANQNDRARIYGNMNQRNYGHQDDSVHMDRFVNYDQHHDPNQDHYHSIIRSEHPSENTSSIDITYRPNSSSVDPQYQRQSRQSNTRRDQHQLQANEAYKRSQDRDSRDTGANANKENSNKSATPKAAKSKSPDNRRVKHHQDKTDIPEDRPKTPAVIPLPPPPEQDANKQTEQQATSRENLPNESGQQQHQKEDQTKKEQSTEFMKPNRETGPLGVMVAIKREVNKLLQEVVNCNETSLTSKEYLRLEELLTRCILRLDDIECGDVVDLRQQRKAIIELIDKCTDILQRKVQLNHDIQNLASKSAYSE